jgi:hypothetical protein
MNLKVHNMRENSPEAELLQLLKKDSSLWNYLFNYLSTLLGYTWQSSMQHCVPENSKTLLVNTNLLLSL